MNEQSKYDQIPLGLLDLLKRILEFEGIVEEKIVSEETDHMEKIIPRVFEVMYRVAKMLCDYVKCGRWSYFWILEALMITARAVDGLADLERVNAINKELTKVIGHFVRVVDVKTLRSAKNSGKHSWS